MADCCKDCDNNQTKKSGKNVGEAILSVLSTLDAEWIRGYDIVGLLRCKGYKFSVEQVQNSLQGLVQARKLSVSFVDLNCSEIFWRSYRLNKEII